LERVKATSSWFGTVVFGVLAIACVVRFWMLGAQDYWLDELHSLLNSAAHRAQFEAVPCGEILSGVPRYTELASDSSARGVWHGMRDDSHPPLYFVLLYGWRRVFGDGEFAARFPAALFSVLSILPVALILREYGKRRVAIGAALLLTFGFAHIQMGQQTRPYSLAMLLVGISYWLLVKMELGWGGFSRRRKVLCAGTYGAALALAMLTHYFAGLALLGQVVYVLVRFRGARMVSWLAAAGVASVAWAVVWLPGLLAQMDFIMGQDWVREQGADHWWRTAVRAADLPVRLLLRTPLHDWQASGVVWQAGVGLGLTISSVIVVWRTRCREALVFLVWFAVPAVVLTVVDLSSDKQLLSHLRYASVIAPGMAGFLAVAAARLRRPAPESLAVIACVLIALTLRLPATSNPDARVAARVVQAEIRPDDLLVFDAIGWIPYWARREFLLVSQYLPRGEYPVLMLNQPPSAATSEQIQAFERILVISPRIDAIPDHTPETHTLVGRSSYIRDVGWVYLFVQSGDTLQIPN
jgi:uncharacterized membrane protein